MNFALNNLKKAVEGLEVVLDREKNEIVRDSAIKRFELCFDLAWKAVKIEAKKEGVECYSPKSCLKEAFQLRLIEHDEGWLEMVDSRNKTTHIYREELAEEIYGYLPEYLEMFKKLCTNLEHSS